MEKIRRILLVLVLLGVMMGISGCLSLPSVRESLPEDTLEEFEDALNEMDVDGMMKCMDEQSVKAITAGIDLVMNIAGAAAGIEMNISAEDLIAMLPLIQGMMGDYTVQGEFPQVDFKVLETYIKGDKATVYFTEVYSGDMVAINMVKEDGKWFLTLNTRGVIKEEADRIIISGQEEEKISKRAATRTERRGERETERDEKISEGEELSDREKMREFFRRLLGD